MQATQAKVEAERKADREETKANQARMEESLKGEMRLTVSAIEEKMEATAHSIRSEQDGKIQRRIENVMERQEIPKEGATVVSLECNGPKDRESEAEHREVPMEEAAGKSLGITKKRHRGRCIAAGRRVKPTKLTQGD
jgi:hypothetical protein